MGEWLFASAQVRPADVSAACTLSRGIARFSHKTTSCKYLNGSKRTGVSKEPSYLFASGITSGAAAVVRWLTQVLVSPALTTSGDLFYSPRISCVRRPRGVSKGFGHETGPASAGGACFYPRKGKHRRILRGLNLIHEHTV